MVAARVKDVARGGCDVESRCRHGRESRAGGARTGSQGEEELVRAAEEGAWCSEGRRDG